MQEKINQLNEKLAVDKGLVEKIFNLETAEEVQSFLKEQGLEFTLEEISTYRDDLIKAEETGNGELTDENLESVAGGAFNPLFIFGPGGPVMLANIKRGRW